MDAGNLLKPMPARASCIASARPRSTSIANYIEKDPALERRFQTVLVEDRRWRTPFPFARVGASATSCTTGAHPGQTLWWRPLVLSHRLYCRRFLPDKAIDLVDEA